jgi:hypothetical protein
LSLVESVVPSPPNACPNEEEEDEVKEKAAGAMTREERTMRERLELRALLVLGGFRERFEGEEDVDLELDAAVGSRAFPFPLLFERASDSAAVAA